MSNPNPLQICLMIGMAHLLVVYRVLAAALFSSFLEQQVTTAVVVTGAVVHYVIIVIMTKVRIMRGGRGGTSTEVLGKSHLVPSSLRSTNV